MIVDLTDIIEWLYPLIIEYLYNVALGKVYL